MNRKVNPFAVQRYARTREEAYELLKARIGRHGWPNRKSKRYPSSLQAIEALNLLMKNDE